MSLILNLVCLTVLPVMGFHHLLDKGETGRYIYQDRHSPEARKICNYCPEISMLSSDFAERDQLDECINKNIDVHDSEEIQSALSPFCKESVGILPDESKICEYCNNISLTSQTEIDRDQSKECSQKYQKQNITKTADYPICKDGHGKRKPGCGNLTLQPFQKSWIVYGLNGLLGEFQESLQSVVYHVYVPACLTGYKFGEQNGHRCGENRQWNDSSLVHCILDDPTALPVSGRDDPTSLSVGEDDVKNGVIVGVVIIAMMISSALVILIILRKRRLCYWKRSKESRIVLPLTVCNVKSLGETCQPKTATDTTVVEEIGNLGRLTSSTRHCDHVIHSHHGNRSTKAPLLLRADSGGSEDEYTEMVTVFGACRIPYQDTEMSSFQVFEGCEIYIITRVRLKRSRTFIVYPPHNSSVNSRLVRQFNFCYVIKDVTDVDAGIYRWKVIDSKKELFSGSFQISVLEGYVRPEPIGCLSENHSVETCSHHSIWSMDDKTNTVSGHSVTPGTCATPSEDNWAKSISSVKSESDTYQSHLKQSSELDITCTKSLEEVWDDQDLTKVIQSLCYLLDPLGGAPRNRRWPGLARWYLGDRMTKPYISSIEYHKKGDPDDGPTLFLLNSFCIQGCYLGHIVWYFSQPENLYQEVIDLLVDCHMCKFCEEIRNSVMQAK